MFLEFEYDTELIALIRQIEGAAWSQTRKAWHIPDTKEAYEQLLLRLPDVEQATMLPQPFWNDIKNKPAETATKLSKPIPANVEIWVIGKHIQVKLPKDEADIQFLQTFKYVRWNRAEYHWVVPNYANNLQLLENYFNTRITELDFRKEPAPKPVPVFDEAYTITELAPLSAENCLELDRFGKWMEHKRYSPSTIETYVQAITTFLRFIAPKSSAEATNEDMQRYVYQYMIPRRLSYSYQNQAVNPVGFKK